MKQFIAFVIKEAKHILRDKRTMLILFGMPVVMMLLFGFAITTDVKNVRTVVVTSEMSPRTQQAVERLAQSEYFIITQTVNTPQEAERLIRSQKADMSLTPSPSPIGEGSSNLQWQIMVDGSDPNMAQQWTTYAQSILSQPVDGKHYSLTSPFGEGLGVRLLYNPQMKSAYNFVPAIMGMLLMLICAMMTSISIVREKEKGTMEVLLVSPVRPLMVIIAKAVPYLVLAFAILITILLMARFVLGVPLAGSLFWILAVSTLYILLALSLAHLQRGTDATRSPAALGYGTADACGDAVGHAVSSRVDASSAAMAGCCGSTTLLYRGYAQADDYGCRFWRSGSRGSCAGWYDGSVARHRPEEV